MDMRVAATSGGAGDIVLSIKVMHTIGVKTVYVKENFYGQSEGSLYSNIKTLLEVNGFEVLPTKSMRDAYEFDPELKYSHNMDIFRLQKNRHKTHILINQHKSFGIPLPGFPFEPWLKIDSTPSGITNDVTLFNVTNRWRKNSKINWKEILGSTQGKKYFIGLSIDHERFQKEAGEIEHFKTSDFLEMARCIRDCKELYCNQSIGVAIGQGIGKEYYLELNPGRTNVVTGTANEHILN